jgi:hypothetical protein
MLRSFSVTVNLRKVLGSTPFHNQQKSTLKVKTTIILNDHSYPWNAEVRINGVLLQPPGSRGSSGSIVSDYGLDDRVIEVRSPTGAEDFSSSH